MEVIGTIEIEDKPLPAPVRRHERAGGIRDMQISLQREILLGVRVNDIPTMQVGCSESHLVELVCGRLFTEGLVRGLGEIDAISICENNLQADVYLADREADLSRRAAVSIATCCTNNRTLNDYFSTGDELAPLTPVPINEDTVYLLADEFALDNTSHKLTYGTHSAFLTDGTEILCVREDIGRHNALDKVVGYALMNDVDLSRCALFTSGRVPTDMVAKVIRAGIPLLVSKATATDQAIQAARDYKLALVCNARPDSFDVLHDPLAVS